MTDIISSIISPLLGNLASSALGSLLGTGTASTVGVANTAPLVFSAAKQAGQNAAVNVENRYGSLGLGNSTMASLDASQARSQPFINAAGKIADPDLQAQEFNPNKAQQYQDQMTQLTTQISGFLGGQQGQAGGQQASQVTDPSAFQPGG